MTLGSEARVETLLARMSLEEKVGQMMQLDGQKNGPDLVRKYHVGSLLHINGSLADEALRVSLVSRTGIPVLLADDGIHGHSFWAGATIFPTQLAMACSWDPDLVEEVGRITAVEMRATGLKWTFSPVLCLARDLRWGRVNETFGEDPYLAGTLGAALVRGLQGRGLGDPDMVLATAKHFAGYSETLGGRDSSEAELSRRKLLSVFLPPFERAAREGALAFMTGYQSIDGVPNTASRWLLTEVLRETWGFQGIVVTDWNNVGHLVHDQKVCVDFAEASALALKAGNDMIMATPEFYEGCLEAVARGLVTVEEIDAVVRRILGLKVRMGLFEDPGFSQPEKIKSLVGCPSHRTVALRMARESLVLLKNDDLSGTPFLPWDPKVPRKLAVVGPNADSPLNQLGDWSLGSGQMFGPSGPAHPRTATVTILDGIRQMLPEGWVLTSPGHADLIVAVVGDSLDYTGETKSTATLELQDGQVEFLGSVAALGKPVVGILVNGKPLVLPKAFLNFPGILECFNPGMLGGTAVAEVLFGRVNPSGKLPVSFPRHAGQLPVYYNAVRGQHGTKYADLTQEPQFAFGFGLSYTEFRVSHPRVSRSAVGRDQSFSVEVEVCNLGNREGTEVVQLYVEDLVTSATWARRELKAWKRVTLVKGAREVLGFELSAADFWIIDAVGRKVVEPGVFRILVGSSSRDCDLKSVDLTVS